MCPKAVANLALVVTCRDVVAGAWPSSPFAPIVNRIPFSIRNQLAHAFDIERALAFFLTAVPLLFLPPGCQKIYRPSRPPSAAPSPRFLLINPAARWGDVRRNRLTAAAGHFQELPLSLDIIESFSQVTGTNIYGASFRAGSSGRTDNLIRVAILPSKLARWRVCPFFRIQNPMEGRRRLPAALGIRVGNKGF